MFKSVVEQQPRVDAVEMANDEVPQEMVGVASPKVPPQYELAA
jgi:hypothetical protein